MSAAKQLAGIGKKLQEWLRAVQDALSPQPVPVPVPVRVPTRKRR